MRTADKARCAVLLLLGAAAVGCAPSSVYDGLSGGTRPGGKEATPSLTSEIAADSSLAPPRPIAPLSVSVIPSSRPVLAWQNIAGATGATVEMARSRTFDGARTFVLDGEKGEVPEDLEPGMWFWRLRSRAPGRTGTQPSSTWQVYVRGPGKTGSGVAPIGAVLDFDGDGEADLLAAGDEPIEGTLMPTLYAFRGGGILAPLEPFSRSAFEESPLGGPVSISGGTDLDGDGFADYAYAGLATLGDPTKPAAEGAPPRYAVVTEYGADGSAKESRSGGVTPLESVSVATTVAAAGDFDGDGYGDLLYAEPHNLMLARGSARGPRDLFPLARLEGPTMLPVLAGLDVNGDGFTDVVHRLDSSEGKRNLSLVTGGRDLAFGGPTTLVPQLDASHQVRALVSGDFDGDGLSDFALGSQREGGGSICVFFGDKSGALRPANCFGGDRGDLDWGIALGAVDLRGEGRDVLLVTAKDASGLRIDAITFDGSTVSAELVVRGEGAVITTLLPGYVGHPGRWAATTAELDAIRIHEGRDRVQTLPPPPGGKAFGRALR